jgi:chromate reductase, NAD(P)H dehydrogenase (quinone)
MAGKPSILAFAGSLRRDSFNKKLVRLAAEAARAEGADVTLLDLRDVPMPVYDGDLEAAEGLPPGAVKLRNLMLAHQGLLVASPEYNSSISAALKNAIDWASRPAPGQEALACFAGKVAGLVSASPGALGGLRGLVHLRSILGNIKVLVLPDQHAIATAHEAFNADGKLKDAKHQAAVANVAKRLVEVTGKLYA